MANRRFIDFPIATTVGDSDIILIWQSGVNKQTTKATFLSGLPENLDELNDVAISGLTNGQILRYDSVTGKWENTDQGNLDLNDLNDVSIVSPSNGQVLVYNSSTSKWENSSGGFVPYTGAVTTVNLGAQTIQAGQFVKAGGTAAQFLKADGSIDSTAYGTGSVTSVGLTMPSAFNVANSPVTTAGTLAVTGAGTVSQYIRGDGSLADFPEASGGGSSVSYYLNGSVNQGTIGGVAYKELSKVPILGAGTDFTINANGYIASFLTDAGDPNLLEIPGGNWNFETYFSASSGGGSPTFYVELYKYDGTTFTLIASSVSAPELIAFGTNIISYFSTLAVPTTTLALTDRLAIRYYVTHSGRTITLHTEDNHLCQIITTFTTGITALNGLTAQVQNFAVGTSGTDFAISSATATHTFNLPTASATNRGALSSADWTTFNGKENAITAGTTLQYFRGDKTFQTLNTAAVPELTNLYYTEARVNANTNVAANTAARHNAVTLGTANGLSLSTQVLSLGLASAGVTGALSGTDWSTFNGKQNALTNPVTGTGTTNYLPKFTGASTIGNSNIQDSGSLVTVGVAAAFSSTISGSYGATFVIPSESPASGSVALVAKTSNGANDIFRWFDGATTLGVFKNNGNVLLGTTTDNGARLQVSGSSRLLDLISGGDSFARVTGNRGNANDLHVANLEFYNSNTSRLVGEIRGITGTGGTQSNSGQLAFYTNDNGTYAERLRIASTGAATFSNSVTAGSSSATNYATLQIMGAMTSPSLTVGTAANVVFAMAAGQELAITANGTAPYGVNFQARNSLAGGGPSGTAYPIILNPLGGNLLVGTTTDNGARFQVSGTATFSDTVTFNGSNNVIRSGNELRFNRTDNLIYTRLYDAGSTFALDNRNGNGFSFQSAGTPQMTIASSGNVGIGTASPSSLLSVSKSSNSGSGSVFPRLQVENTLATQGNGSSTFNFADIRIATGNGSAEMYLASSFASGTWEPQGLISVATNHPMIFRTNNTEQMRITSGGNVLIGTTTDGGYKLDVAGKARVNNSDGFFIQSSSQFRQIYFDGFSNLYFWNGSNQSLLTSAGVWQNASDVSIKKEITNIKYGLSDLMLLNPRSYKMKTDGLEQIGFIAQEVEKIIPEVVNSDNKGMKGLSYGNMVSLLVKAIQELKQEIDTLKN